MTKFLAYYNLCQIHDPKEFLGISHDKIESNIIATMNRNMILVIKMSTQKQVQSWSVVEKLSSKVIYDHESQTYVAVFGNRFLRTWSDNVTDINKCKKLKFRKSIAHLVSLGRGKSTFILYSDGSCEPLQIALNERGGKDSTSTKDTTLLTSRTTFISPKISKMPDGRLVLTYFDRNNNTNAMELVRSTLSDKSKTMRFKLERNINGSDVTLAGWAILDGNETPILLTLWSDKRLFLLNLNDSVQPISSPGSYVSMLNDLKLDQPLSILGLSNNFVAIYGANSGQEGASLLLYNTQFKVIKTKQFFKVYFNFSHLWEVDEHILLAMGQNLSVVSYHISKELLADLVGTQVYENNFQQDSIEMDLINEDDFFHECTQYAGRFVKDTEPQKTTMTNNDEQMAARRNSKTTTIENLGTELAFKSTHTFNDGIAVLDRLQLNVEVLSINNENVYDDNRITLLPTKQCDWSNDLPHIQIIAEQLEFSGASEHEIIEKLLPLLIEANLLSDIRVCLQRYTSIPERMIAKTLRYLLDKMTSNNDEKQDVIVIEILRVLLMCSFQSQTLAIHTRHELNYDHIITLIDFLYSELTADEYLIEPQYVIEPPAVYIEQQLLSWFSVCIDTCFQELAISKDCRLVELIVKWQDLVARYKLEVALSTQVLALLYNLVERRKCVNNKNSSKWYSIEEVTLY